MNLPSVCGWMAAAIALIGGCSESNATNKSDSQASHDNAVVKKESPRGRRFVAVNPYDPARDAVNDYDPARDAANDFAITVKLATDSKKRILIEIGGRW